MANNTGKIFIFIVSLAISLTTTVGCSSRALQLDETDNGKIVTVKVGNDIIITLPGNPSTGYSWEVKTIDPASLKLVGDPVFAGDSSNLVGSGGTLLLTFETKKTGSSRLELVYHRPWENGVEPLQTYSIQVVIE